MLVTSKNSALDLKPNSMHYSRGSQKKKLWYDDGDHHPPLFLITWSPLKSSSRIKIVGLNTTNESLHAIRKRVLSILF